MTSSMSGSAAAMFASESANASTARCICTLACEPMRSTMPRIARRELPGVEPAGLAGDVAHQPRRELDLVQDPQDGEQRPQVAGERVLQREQLVDPLLELDDRRLVVLVHREDLVDHQQVGVEERLGRGADLLAHTGRELDHVVADLGQVLVVRSSGSRAPVLTSRRGDCGRRVRVPHAILPRLPRPTARSTDPVHEAVHRAVTSALMNAVDLELRTLSQPRPGTVRMETNEDNDDDRSAR